MKITAPLAQALTNLRGNRDFEVVLEHMQEHQTEETARCIDGEGSIQLRASGAVKTLQWWRAAFESAPRDLEIFKNQSR